MRRIFCLQPDLEMSRVAMMILAGKKESLCESHVNGLGGLIWVTENVTIGIWQ